MTNVTIIQNKHTSDTDAEHSWGGEWAIFDSASREKLNDFDFLTANRAVDWATSNDMRVDEVRDYNGEVVL